MTLHALLLVVAVILLLLAGVGAFGWVAGINVAGCGWTGLATLAASFLAT